MSTTFQVCGQKFRPSKSRKLKSRKPKFKIYISVTIPMIALQNFNHPNYSRILTIRDFRFVDFGIRDSCLRDFDLFGILSLRGRNFEWIEIPNGLKFQKVQNPENQNPKISKSCNGFRKLGIRKFRTQMKCYKIPRNIQCTFYLCRWFTNGLNPHNKVDDWLYSGGYWDRNYDSLLDLDIFQRGSYIL